MPYFPDDPYGSLPDEMREFFGQIPGTGYFDNDAQERIAADLYATGFGYHSHDYDDMGIDSEAVHAAREEFLDFMGLEWDSFPWDEWREAMGYDEG